MRYTKLLCWFCAILMSSTSLAGSESYTEQSRILLKELEQEIAATMLAVAKIEKEQGNTLHTFECLLLQKKKDFINLGLIFDLENIKNGYEVIAVDSGSVADSLGIKVKDIVLEVNGIQLIDLKKRKVLRILSDLKIDQTLTLALKSNGEYKTVSSVLTGLHIPAVTLSLGEFAENACGIDPV